MIGSVKDEVIPLSVEHFRIFVQGSPSKKPRGEVVRPQTVPVSVLF